MNGRVGPKEDPQKRFAKVSIVSDDFEDENEGLIIHGEKIGDDYDGEHTHLCRCSRQGSTRRSVVVVVVWIGMLLVGIDLASAVMEAWSLQNGSFLDNVHTTVSSHVSNFIKHNMSWQDIWLIEGDEEEMEAEKAQTEPLADLDETEEIGKEIVTDSVTKKSNGKCSYEDRMLQERLEEKCGYFMSRMNVWNASATEKLGHIEAWAQRSGTGDRLAGLVSAFYHAFNTRERLQVNWNTLDLALAPSCLMRDIVSINDTSQLLPESKTCRKRSCSAARDHVARCPDQAYHLADSLTSIRACTSSRRCREMAKYYGEENLTLAHTIGCPIRLMFDPTEELLQLPVQYFMDGKIRNATLQGLEKIVRQFKTITLHIRRGDSVLLHHRRRRKMMMTTTTNASLKTIEKKLGSARRCMHWVDQKLAKTATPVKWIISSDDENVRLYFRETFPDKVIMLTERPRHIHYSGGGQKLSARKITMDTFAEWYLLGLGDELIANQGFHGISAFSKFSWLWNLKSRFYSVRFRGKPCFHKEFEYDGNTRLFSDQCLTNPYIGKHDFDRENFKWLYSKPKKFLDQLPRENDV